MTWNFGFLLFFLGLAAFGLYYGLLHPYLTGEMQAEKRRQRLVRTPTDIRERARQQEIIKRRKQVSLSLSEIATQGKKRKKDLETRLYQAGLTLSKKKFIICALGIGLLLACALLFLTFNPLYAVLGFGIGALGLPDWFLRFKIKRRAHKFTHDFPEAIEIIVRGIKTGLPLGDCIYMVSMEMEEPVKTEFRLVMEAQSVGLSMAEAIDRMVDRVPTAEVNFFSIVVSIQQKSGGNLAEALGNLAKVLRDRRRMRLKIKAMAGEAKASAFIIGSLPFGVAFLVYLSSPDYIELLWTTPTGRLVLIACLFWVSIGIVVMRKMINFEV